MDALLPGAMVTVLRPGQDHPAISVRVLGVTAAALTVEAADLQEFTAGESALLAHGPRTGRLVAAGKFGGIRGPAALFLTPRGWQDYDRRQDPRYPLGVPAQVRGTGIHRDTRAVVRDISSHGIALELAARPIPRRVHVLVNALGLSATLPCDVVGWTEEGDGGVLHLRYPELEAVQQAFVRGLVRRLEEGIQAVPGAHKDRAA